MDSDRSEGAKKGMGEEGEIEKRGVWEDSTYRSAGPKKGKKGRERDKEERRDGKSAPTEVLEPRKGRREEGARGKRGGKLRQLL